MFFPTCLTGTFFFFYLSGSPILLWGCLSGGGWWFSLIFLCCCLLVCFCFGVTPRVNKGYSWLLAQDFFWHGLGTIWILGIKPGLANALPALGSFVIFAGSLERISKSSLGLKGLLVKVFCFYYNINSLIDSVWDTQLKFFSWWISWIPSLHWWTFSVPLFLFFLSPLPYFQSIFLLSPYFFLLHHVLWNAFMYGVTCTILHYPLTHFLSRVTISNYYCCSVPLYFLTALSWYFWKETVIPGNYYHNIF